MKTAFLCFAVLSLSCAPALAQEGNALGPIPGSFTTNVTLTSDYVFRGISQSDEDPAVQGSVDWSLEPLGLYLGAWTSTADVAGADLEMDFYGGINGVDTNFTWDLGAIYYAYPGADDDVDANFWELAAAAGYDFNVFSVSAALNYSPDYFGGGGDSLYPAAYLSVPLPYHMTASASLGYLWTADSQSFGTDDYADWSVGVGAELYGFEGDLKYHDTSLDDGDCRGRGCDGRLVLSVGKTF